MHLRCGLNPLRYQHDAPAPANSRAPAGRLPQPWLALARLGRPAAGPPNAPPGARVCQWPSTVTELPDLPLSGPCQHLARGRITTLHAQGPDDTCARRKIKQAPPKVRRLGDRQ